MAILTIEIPDAVASVLVAYMAQQATSSPDKAVAGAVSLWLLQNGYSGPELTRAYLDAAFPYSGADAA